MRFLILFAFSLSGTAALIYEVTWMRGLSLVFGSTTYALSTMLGTFMAGLALGGYAGGWMADKRKNMLMLFGLLELGIGIFGLITIPLIHFLSSQYLRVYDSFYSSPSAYFAVQFILCAGIMLIPTTLMGATFPVVSKRVTDEMDEMGRGVGKAYSFNTFGAILGSFSAGFVLIPTVGVRLSTIIAASLNIVIALTMIFLSRVRIRGAVTALFILFFLASLAASLFYEAEKWPVNFYTANRYMTYDEVVSDEKGSVILFNKDYVEGRVKLWKDRMGFLVLQAGGKFEGSSVGDIANTHLLAYLPIASHPGPDSFFLIGLGTGFTLSAAKEHIRSVMVAEINGGIVDALKMFGPRDLFQEADVFVNDGRNHLRRTKRRFDIISSGPSYPTEAGSGNLFTKEFYELAASRLNPGGIFCQAVPYYVLSNDDVTMLLKTFRSVFNYAYLWKSGPLLDRILVGSKEPFQFSEEEITKRTRELNVRRMPVTFSISRTPEQIEEIVRTQTEVPLNTDDRPLIEFHAARNMLTGVVD